MNWRTLPYLLTVTGCYAVVGSAVAQEVAYTTPCGYVQTQLYAKETCYVGQGVHSEALVRHEISAENVGWVGNKVTLTDEAVDFTALMTATEAYVLEWQFNGKSLYVPVNRDGKGQWNQHSITVENEVLAELVKTQSPDGFVLRKARTLNDLLGADNSWGLTAGSAAKADAVSLYVSATDKMAVYYSGTEWRKRGSKADVGATPVFSPEPLTVQRKKGDDVVVFIRGEVSDQKPLIEIPAYNVARHTCMPLAQTLGQLNFSLSSDALISIPIGEKDAPVEVEYKDGAWLRKDDGTDVGDVPFHGAFSVYYGLSKTPALLTEAAE